MKSRHERNNNNSFKKLDFVFQTSFKNNASVVTRKSTLPDSVVQQKYVGFVNMIRYMNVFVSQIQMKYFKFVEFYFIF